MRASPILRRARACKILGGGSHCRHPDPGRRGLKRPHQVLAGVAPADLGCQNDPVGQSLSGPCTGFGRFSICIEFSQFLPIRKCCNAAFQPTLCPLVGDNGEDGNTALQPNYNFLFDGAFVSFFHG
jgi:hypothetical protein